MQYVLELGSDLNPVLTSEPGSSGTDTLGPRVADCVQPAKLRESFMILPVLDSLFTCPPKLPPGNFGYFSLKREPFYQNSHSLLVLT